MNFWDSSAVTPLIIREDGSAHREGQVSRAPRMIVWFGTLAEVESAISRWRGLGEVSEEAASQARGLLLDLASVWTEVAPTNEVRARAIRLLRVHPLRPADAFQLAAALVFCEDQPQCLPFLTADHRLREVAAMEGFPGE